MILWPLPVIIYAIRKRLLTAPFSIKRELDPPPLPVFTSLFVKCDGPGEGSVLKSTHESHSTNNRFCWIKTLNCRWLFCQVIQIYKDPDGNPLKRGTRASGLSRGTPYSASMDALQNRVRLDQAEKEAEEVLS